jgi:hypothetical protein
MRIAAITLVSALLASGLSQKATAQSVLTGTVVVDATPSPPLSDAEIAIAELKLLARTDSLGRFLFNQIPKGTYRVTVRRLGYQGMAVNAKFSGTDTLAADFALTALSVTLDTVSVKGQAVVPGKFREFEERRVSGFGSFMTREDLDKQRDRPLGEIMTRLSGVRYNRYGSEGAIASHRWSGGRSRGGDSFDRRKGAPGGCYAQVFLDGIRVFSSNPGEPLFNINSLEPSSIQGIEYYASAAQTPIQFDPRNADCGTVVIWTRIE